MNTCEQIREFLLQEFAFGDPQKMVTNDQPLLASAGGIVDSIGLQDFLSHLEQTFSIEIDELEMVPNNFSTIDLVVEFVDSKLVGLESKT